MKRHGARATIAVDASGESVFLALIRRQMLTERVIAAMDRLDQGGPARRADDLALMRTRVAEAQAGLDENASFRRLVGHWLLFYEGYPVQCLGRILQDRMTLPARLMNRNHLVVARALAAVDEWGNSDASALMILEAVSRSEQEKALTMLADQLGALENKQWLAKLALARRELLTEHLENALELVKPLISEWGFLSAVAKPRGAAAIALNRYGDARESLRMVTNSNPGNVATHLALTRCHHQLSRARRICPSPDNRRHCRKEAKCCGFPCSQTGLLHLCLIGTK